ncbi:unnamed protein product, partial [Meganyctiphanes norvegica]
VSRELLIIIFTNRTHLCRMLKGLILAALAALIAGHGYMIYPAQRSSLWRYGIDSPFNYEDNELFCGGLTNMWDVNDGKCGECGDPYQDPRPRANEAGGLYGNGIIFKEFKAGEVVDVDVTITTNHRGWFEFKLCPVSSPTELVTQECLDQHPLHVADGVSGTRYWLTDFGKGNFTVPVKLPDDITCDQCVMQWWYQGGNNWGDCGNGTSTLGCGAQETFVNCADIAIH